MNIIFNTSTLRSSFTPVRRVDTETIVSKTSPLISRAFGRTSPPFHTRRPTSGQPGGAERARTRTRSPRRRIINSTRRASTKHPPPLLHPSNTQHTNIMRGVVALATGGGLPPRQPGGGGKGEASFDKKGSVSFKAGGSGGGGAGAGPNAPSAIFKSAVTCAGLGVVGDFIAQTVDRRSRKRASDAAAAAAAAAKGKKKDATAGFVDPGHDYPRTRRQCAYNFVFYGPLQHFWYQVLAAKFPTPAGASLAKNFSPFAMKVFLNQAVLGPVVVSTFFAWSMALQGQMSAYPAKIERDLYPTLQRGWKFWVPAATINFAVVPVGSQVLYMSCCSIVWNYILSQAAGKAMPAPPPAGGDRKKK